MEKYIIVWRNKYSGEQGYVAAVSAKGKHFISTTHREDAKRYCDRAAAKCAVTKLTSYGEAVNNDFEIMLAHPVFLGVCKLGGLC